MSKVSVLVVDDATFIRDLVKKGLRDHFPGIQLEEAVNGRKAQQLLNRQAVDLILCDWEMPKMSGLELLSWCRGEEAHKGTPFIMVTSRGDKEIVVQAIQAGVSDYIGKPFSNDQLVTKVKKALSRTGKLAQLSAPTPQRINSAGAFANDSLSALTGGKAQTVKSSSAKAVSAAAAASVIKPPAKLSKTAASAVAASVGYIIVFKPFLSTALPENRRTPATQAAFIVKYMAPPLMPRASPIISIKLTTKPAKSE